MNIMNNEQIDDLHIKQKLNLEKPCIFLEELI